MTLPAFLFGCLIAILLGSAFHLWKGGGLWHIIMYILFGLAGFWLGHLASVLLDFHLWDIGPIHFGPALAGALIFLFIARWLFYFSPPQVTS